MKNKYVEFISDEHLIKCISNLFSAYSKAKAKVTRKSFYANKVDIFKLTFDSKFNDIKDEKLVEAEILRQIDKSINNSIGTFHEEILGGVKGFQKGNLSGYDIKANDDTLFADIKNKHNTMNSSAAESLFQKLKHYADTHKQAKCYWVQILAKSSFNTLWSGDINGKEYSHSRVFKISGDQFYKLVTGRENALFELYAALPIAIDDFLKSNELQSGKSATVLKEIKKDLSESRDTNRTIIDQITFDNYSYYLGFKKL